MNLTLTPPIRIIALAGLIVIIALGGMLMVLGRPGAGTPTKAGERHGSATPEKTTTTPATHVAAVAKVNATSTTAAKTVVVHAKATTSATAHKTATHHKTAAQHKAATKHKAVTHKAAKPTFRGNPVYADLPAPLQWQLAHNKVVVVSFYNPNADVDAISVAEAHAGAVEAGAGFLLVSVLDNKVAGILTALLPDGGLLPQPGVLIYHAPGTIAVRIDGFADRDSIAQAATNASTMTVSASAATP